ncbi:hypothetical protein GCM10008931_43840 [Oceanobacillus oncorhynchi subsp. oncorhynchi]|uniref:hypothetical protein n=1 Tax=Oceanobacillus oncorhynchi TaxID=545501 RepID=UPI0031DD0011
MGFKVSRKVNWEMRDRWDYALELVKSFNKEFSLKVESVSGDNIASEFTFYMGSTFITFHMSEFSSSITLSCGGSKENFDKRYDYVFNKFLKDKV